MYDITRIVEGWDYDPDEVTVRLVQGDDNLPKVQMRLDLGLLQMEYDGRPDGKQPFGFESLLEYYEHELKEYVEENDSEEGFYLDSDDCASLRSEALQYYYRYLSLFHLQKFDAVERDTARNLRVFDLLKKYAEEEEDRYSLEQYRPYVTMMHARAAAYRLLELNDIDEALDRVESGIERIKQFYIDLKHPELAKKSAELLLLVQLRSEIENRWQKDPVYQLRERMKEAVAREDYEAAALIRDEIKKMQEKSV